ncbi:putative diguanylate cyclase YcdT [Planococcus massiliensis]|uniref:Putative diguanylate cyclase YcdT n=1 Tax=Planococcus massiliensis TaxID=1499687 RepID=A0A098EGR3_9BACL|nr:GGDEF domain-containing protein [Planococcus massiliensis]CEG21489.1 putative diguanylate cyclase YcdT [Planococcus massiliensis]
MQEQKDWNDTKGLNKLILKTSWLMVFIIIFISAAGVIIINQYNDKSFFQVMSSYVFLPTLCTVVILALTHLFYVLFNRWGDYILTVGVLAIMHVYIINFPFAPGIHYLLIISVLISALYFQKQKVYFTSILSLISFFSLYFFYEPFSSEIARSDIFAFIGIFIGFICISVGIIYRGDYLLKHLEESMRSQEELLVRNILMDRENKTDALTGLYNHKTFYEHLDRLIEKSSENQISFQLAIIDIDDFKAINDQYGHWIGDMVLKRVGEQFKLNATTDDFVFRYGGEEFAVILTAKNKTESFQVMDKIRADISRLTHSEMDHKSVTVSIGMCSYEVGLGKEAFFKAADNSLYKAKRNGKNQTIMVN